MKKFCSFQSRLVKFYMVRLVMFYQVKLVDKLIMMLKLVV
jgi:hypothetical protein